MIEIRFFTLLVEQKKEDITPRENQLVWGFAIQQGTDPLPLGEDMETENQIITTRWGPEVHYCASDHGEITPSESSSSPKGPSTSYGKYCINSGLQG